MEPFVIGESQMVTQRERRSIRGLGGGVCGEEVEVKILTQSSFRLHLIEPASVLYVNRRRFAKIYSLFLKGES